MTQPGEMFLGQEPAAFWLSNAFEDNNNPVVLVSNDEEEETSSMDAQSESTFSGEEEGLVQAFGEFSVDIDPLNSINDAATHQDIPSCNATVNSDTEMAVEQSFLMEDQALLDLDPPQGTASLSPNGVLTIITTTTAPVCFPIQVQIPPSTYSMPDASRVSLHVPGVNPQDVQVSYHAANGELTVSGCRFFGRVLRTFHKTIPVDSQKYNPDEIQCYLHRAELFILLPAQKPCCSLDIIEPDYL